MHIQYKLPYLTGLFLFLLLFSHTSWAQQTTISGTVVSTDDGSTLAGVNVVVKGKLVGTSTGVDGEFSLEVAQDPPFTLVFSMVGFTKKEIEITQPNTTGLTVELSEASILVSDVVVSASRVEEDEMQSPVTIEKMDVIDVQQSAGPTFYESLKNLKGVDFSTQSITFKSVNTRGFNANGNTRFVQLIDGIDNQAPGLNFPVGNVVGIPEMDLESAELIPGVASALYGPNALNGILLLESKSPFDYQGVSAQVKTGFNHVESDVEDISAYQHYAVRYANAVNNKFAYKINVSFLDAKDFVAQDRRDQGPRTFGAIERGSTQRNGNRVFDGINIYGEPLLNIGEIADDIIADGGAQGAQIEGIRGLLPDGELGNFTPTGFPEASFIDNDAESLKLGSALHYRLNDNLELLGQFNWGRGSTVFTANDRFILDDFKIWTGKAELKSSNFFVRAYTTQENAGDTFAANTMGSLINAQTFVPAYFQTFANARTQGATVEEAHQAARQAGEAAQAKPGTEEFKELFNEIRNTPISEGGAQFLDETGLWHGETMYNFSELVDPEKVEIIVGGNVRRFDLESDGTLFALDDDGDEFNIDEYGFYTQLSKNLFEDKLDLQGAVRFDKNENFDGQISPRVSAVYTLFGNHNIRASFQRGFRIPTTQTQFIDLDVVTRRLVGSNPKLVDRFNFRTNTVYRTESVEAAREALEEGASLSEARSLLQSVEFEEFETEKVTTFEIGYKALIADRLKVDAYYYYSNFDDFIAEIDFTQAIDGQDDNSSDGFDPVGGGFDPDSESGQNAIINDNVSGGRLQRFGFDVNADGDVKAQGFAIGADFIFGQGYTLGGNVAYNDLISQEDLIEQGFRANYNTPNWRYVLKFQNRKLTENLGFNISYRWQDAFLWESSFSEGIVESFGTVDAQISYKLPAYNTTIKLSGSNLLNNWHTTSIGNPRLGGIYLLTLRFDQFLN